MPSTLLCTRDEQVKRRKHLPFRSFRLSWETKVFLGMGGVGMPVGAQERSNRKGDASFSMPSQAAYLAFVVVVIPFLLLVFSFVHQCSNLGVGNLLGLRHPLLQSLPGIPAWCWDPCSY